MDNAVVLSLYTTAILAFGLYFTGVAFLELLVLPTLAGIYLLSLIPWPFYAAFVVALIAVAKIK